MSLVFIKFLVFGITLHIFFVLFGSEICDKCGEKVTGIIRLSIIGNIINMLILANLIVWAW